MTMTVEGRGEVVLVVGKVADEEKKEWYAQVEGDASGTVWVLRDYVVRQMTKSSDGFKKKDSA